MTESREAISPDGYFLNEDISEDLSALTSGGVMLQQEDEVPPEPRIQFIIATCM